MLANLTCGSCCSYAVQVLGPSHRRGSLQAAHSTLQQIDYSVGPSVWAAWPEECKARCSCHKQCTPAAPPKDVSCLLQFYRRLEDAGEEITEEFLWGRLQPLLHYLPDDQVAKV